MLVSIQSETLSEEEYLRTILCSHVYEVAQVTPLQKMERISSRLMNSILVKREDRQPVHSFKLRGAHAMITSLSEEEKNRGVITASAGNHAQGVGFSVRKLGIKSLIVMPVCTADIKVDSVRALGCDVYLYGGNFDEAKDKALELALKYSYTFIDPFDHPLVIAGHGTLGMELLQQDAHIDRIFVPVGGGGLISGISILIKQLMPHVKIIGVESVDSACLDAAFKVGYPIDLPKVGLFAEGVAVKRIGVETFRICKKYLDDIILVDNDAVCAAMKDLFEDIRAIAEPAGALALAGLKKYVQKYSIKNERIVHILSGANVNFHSLRYVSERCELGEEREALFGITIPEKQGSFLKFCKKLGGRSITEFSYRLSNLKYAYIFVGISLKSGLKERKEMLMDLISNGYQIVDLSDDEMAKLHVRYMIGGRPKKFLSEKLFSFEFPEAPGALLGFLENLGNRWNISLFHYRSHGSDYGRVLVGFEVDTEIDYFKDYISSLNYEFHEESNSPSFHFFLSTF